MRKRLKIKGSIIVFVLCLCAIAYSAVSYLRVFTFDEDESLARWNKMVLNGEVEYTLVKQGEEGYVKALSENACSALYYRVGFKLRKYPFLSWRWRVLEFPDTSVAKTEEEKDDYAARVYVIFPFLSFSSSKFLEYVWAEDVPMETIIDSPFGDNVKMLVARSGRASKGEWVDEARNVYDDYIKAFGERPRMSVGAIAIMCDADGTKTSAQSFFDNIAIEGR